MPRARRTVLVLTATATWLLPSAAHSQDDTTPRFRSSVQLVQVFAVVRDRSGKVVEDLDARDFEIHDRNQPVDVSTFAHVRVQPPRAPSATTGPDADQDGVRAFTILYDDLHSAPQRVVAARRVADRLITRWVRPADLVAVRRVSDDGKFQLLPAGTRELALQQAAQLAGGVTRQPLHDQERVGRVVRLMRVLAAVADATGHTPERRAVIVLVSEGVDYDIFNVARAGSGDVVRATEAAILTLRRSNAVLYTIDPRGLASGEAAVVETGGSGAAGAATSSEASRGLADARGSLRHLAEETGGFAAINGNDLDRATDRVGDELSSYYLLGVYPAPEGCDGSFNPIRVKVRRAHLRVSARRGYACDAASR